MLISLSQEAAALGYSTPVIWCRDFSTVAYMFLDRSDYGQTPGQEHQNAIQLNLQDLHREFVVFTDEGYFKTDINM
jgi:hypothetical protein